MCENDAQQFKRRQHSFATRTTKLFIAIIWYFYLKFPEYPTLCYLHFKNILNQFKSYSIWKIKWATSPHCMNIQIDSISDLSLILLWGKVICKICQIAKKSVTVISPAAIKRWSHLISPFFVCKDWEVLIIMAPTIQFISQLLQTNGSLPAKKKKMII